MEVNTDIAIIGAGITGLTVAYYINKANKNFLIIDKNSTYGGVINTLEQDGFKFETGPNTGVLSSLEAVKLFENLNGQPTGKNNEQYHLETAGKNAKKRFIYKDGEFRAMPNGPWSAITTRLFSLKDKFRILGEPFRKRGTNPNETLAEFVKRRMGQSYLDYAIDPFVSGIYGGDPNELVPKYAFPKLYNLEQKYGSLIGGSIKKRREPKQPGAEKITRATFSAENGLSNLTSALYEQIGKEKFCFDALGVEVEKEGEGYKVSFKQNSQKVVIHCKTVVNTAGAYEFPNLFPFVDQESKDAISKLKYAGVVECAVGFKNYNGIPLEGFGGLVPTIESKNILGILYMSNLFNNRAPKDSVLIAVYMGGIKKPQMLNMSDFEIKQLASKDVCQILHIKDFNPDVFKVFRHWNAIPQYAQDSQQRFDAIKKVETENPGIIIAGNMHGGIGMSDRIKQATQVAERIINQ